MAHYCHFQVCLKLILIFVKFASEQIGQTKKLWTTVSVMELLWPESSLPLPNVSGSPRMPICTFSGSLPIIR